MLTISITSLFPTLAQENNTDLVKSPAGKVLENFSVSAYLDAYFGYDFSRPKEGKIPYFVSMNRHNEATINLAFVDVRYQSERLRGRFAPGFGTYMNANYQNETGVVRHLVEASVGYQISKSKDSWVDIGILGSPYTNESAISRDHLMYTRSFAPEYVPYYLFGVKVSLPLSEKLTAYLYFINGWQQIKDQNQGKAIGTQVEYRPNSNNLINWNTYWGDERSSSQPDDRLRAFSDLYWIYNGEGKWDFTSCIYGGFQNNLSERFNSEVFWWQVNFITRYSFSQKASLSGRVEYFSDPHSIQISSQSLRPSFRAFSQGICFNYTPQSKLLLRLEGRYFQSPEKVFLNSKEEITGTKFWLIGGVTLSF